MKKNIAFLFLALVLIALMWGCENSTQTAIDQTTSQIATIENRDQITFVPDKIKQNTFDSHLAFRSIYYYGFDGVDELFAPGAIQNFLDDMGRGYKEYPDEMVLLTMIKKYDLPKENLEEAIKRAAEDILSRGRNLSEESDELPNPDIIYTFDNEIINGYYRREDPIAPDWSTLKTYESYSEFQKANSSE
jgi:hypothetical protein